MSNHLSARFTLVNAPTAEHHQGPKSALVPATAGLEFPQRSFDDRNR
jgi:hypothetical protein